MLLEHCTGLATCTGGPRGRSAGGQGAHSRFPHQFRLLHSMSVVAKGEHYFAYSFISKDINLTSINIYSSENIYISFHIIVQNLVIPPTTTAPQRRPPYRVGSIDVESSRFAALPLRLALELPGARLQGGGGFAADACASVTARDVANLRRNKHTELVGELFCSSISCVCVCLCACDCACVCGVCLCVLAFL